MKLLLEIKLVCDKKKSRIQTISKSHDMQLYLCLHDLLIYSWWCDRLLFWLYQIILLVIPTGACFFVIGQDRIGLIRGNCWRKLLCCSLSKYRMETLVCPLYPPLHDIDNNDDCYAWKLEFKQVGLIHYFRKNLIKTHHKSCDWKVFKRLILLIIRRICHWHGQLFFLLIVL